MVLNRGGLHETLRADLVKVEADASEIEAELRGLTENSADLGILLPVDQITTIALYHADIHAKYFVPLQKRKGA